MFIQMRATDIVLPLPTEHTQSMFPQNAVNISVIVGKKIKGLKNKSPSLVSL